MPQQKVTSQDTLEPVSESSVSSEDTGASGLAEDQGKSNAELPLKQGVDLRSLMGEDGSGEHQASSEGKPASKPALKYKSIEEYDKAYGESEKKMHEATTKASQLEKEINDLKNTVVLLSQAQAQKTKESGPDPVMEVQNWITSEIQKLDFANDAEGSAKKLSEIIVTANQKLGSHLIQSTTQKQTSEDATHKAIQERLKPLGLDKHYRTLFLPTLDRLIDEDPVFRALPGEIKFQRVVEEIKSLIEGFRNSSKESESERTGALKAGSGMGKGAGPIPIKREGEDQNVGLGSIAEDMKEMKKSKRLPASVF